MCVGGRLFGEAAGRADGALPYTAAPGPGGPGRPATIDSAALQPPVDVQTPSRSNETCSSIGILYTSVCPILTVKHESIQLIKI